MERFRNRLKNLTGILFKEQNRILSAVSSLAILSLLTKLSGLLFKALQASQFGASRENDIFNAANAVPEMITITLLTGAVAGSIIPVLVKSRQQEEHEQFVKFFNSLLNIGVIVFTVVSILVVLFSTDVVFLARDLKIIDPPDKPFTHEEYLLIANMMKLLMIPQAILGVSAYVSSTLNVFERFIIPSLAPLFYNVGRIIGVSILVDLMGGAGTLEGITGVVWGTYIGAILHLLIQLPLLWHIGVRYKFEIDFKSKYLKYAAKLSLPRVFSLAGEQISLLVNKVIALSLISGSLSALDFAYSLISIPLSLIGATFAVASFPSLSKFFEQNDLVSFSNLFRRIINQIFFLAIPIAVIIFVLRVPLTRLFFGILGGEFSWENTQQVAWIIFFFSLGLAFETMRSFMFRAFYSVHDSKKPLIVSMIVMVLGIFAAIGLSNYFSHFNSYDVNNILGNVQVINIERDLEGGAFAIKSISIDPEINLLPKFSFDKFFVKSDGISAVGGLALSTSIVFTFEFILLFYFLHSKKILNNMRMIVNDFGKKIIAGISMVGISYLMFKFWEQVLNTTRTASLTFLTFAIVSTAILFYLWVSSLLKVEEVDLVIDYISLALRKLQAMFPFLTKIRNFLRRF